VQRFADGDKQVAVVGLVAVEVRGDDAQEGVFGLCSKKNIFRSIGSQERYSWFLACLAALELDGVALEEI